MQKTAYCRRAILRIDEGCGDPLRSLCSGWRNRGITKILLVVKLTMFLLTAAFLQMQASGRAQTVTLSGKHLEFRQVIAAVEEQTGFVFFYKGELLQEIPAISISATDQPLEVFLSRLFSTLPVDYTIRNKTIFLSKKIPPPPAAVSGELVTGADEVPGGIVGTVRDANGAFLPNMNVTVKGTQRITSTDSSGRFSIDAAAGDVLVISGIGFETQQVKVSKAGFVNVILSFQSTVMDTAAVSYNTGYQTISSERATGSFGKPDMETFSKRTGTLDVIDRMEGLVAGLTVTPGPTGQSPNLNGNGVVTQRSILRGITTVNLGTDPLYVVNGVIVPDFSSVNPDDIKDITLLKDAAAAAIWGAHAANGVVIVVTKTGSRNQPLRIDYSGFINYTGKPDFSYRPQLNSRQYIQTSKELFNPTAYPYGDLYDQFIPPDQQIQYDAYRGLISAQQANASLDSLASINNLSQIKSLWYRPAFTTNHTLSVSGGSNNYSFYASLGYTDAQSNQPGNRNNTYKIDLTQSINAGRNIKVTLHTSLIDNVSSGKNYISISNQWLPYQLFKDAKGNNIPLPYMLGWSDSLRQDYQARSGINLNYSPLDEVNAAHYESNSLNFNVTADVAVKLWRGISFDGTYGYLSAPGTNSSYDDHSSLDQRLQLLNFTVAPTIGSTPVYYLPTTGGQYTTGNNDQRNWTVRNQLVYNAEPRGRKDQLSIQVGQEATENFTSNSSSTLLGYNEALGTWADLDYATLKQGISGTIPYGYSQFYGEPYSFTKSLSRFISYFSLLDYTINGKYSIDASWRQDKSNLFGHDVSTQSKPIWSFGAKWLLGKESFMQGKTWGKDLAIRTTYGITGNSPYVGAASLYDILNANPQNRSGGIAGDALEVFKPANRGLSWENTKTFNAAVDYAFLDRRISGGLDFYVKTTTDLIAELPLGPFSGFDNITGNLGKLINKGFELTVRTVNIRQRDFSWTTNFVFSYNKNKLVSFVEANAQLNSVSNLLYATYAQGYSQSPLFAYRYAGLDSLGDPQIRTAKGVVTKVPYLMLEPGDLKYMGTTQPVFNGGLSNTFGYKRISLSVNMIYSLGAVMRRDVNRFYTGRLASSAGFSTGNVDPSFLNRWKNPGDEKKTDIPSYVPGFESYQRRNVNYYQQADINVVSASYVKIKDLTLSYDLAPQMLSALKIQRLNIFAQATNFMVWKANHYNIDPQYQSQSTRILPPFKHGYSLGLTLNF